MTPALAPHTATPDAYIVLDDDDRIVHVSDCLRDALAHWRGHILWDHLPSARDVYGPLVDEARTSAAPAVGVVFYSGRVKRLTVIPGADGLAVHVERLAELDVTTLGTLMRSLEEIERVLADQESAQRDPRAHASLRALP